MSTVSFSSTYLAAKNKKGNLKPDSNGYYEVVVGGLNVYNSAGQFYTYNESAELFNNSSFKRRIENGSLYSEVGHPVREPGMTDDQFLDRFLTIRETNISGHFNKVWLDHDSIKSPEGRPVVAIMAKVKPAGPFGPALKESLDNPDANTAFSVRGFTKDVNNAGRRDRILKTIITFDWVTEPGISIATKWSSPALESLTDTEVTKRDFEKLERKITVNNVSTEARSLFNDLKWVEEEFRFKGSKPTYLKF